MSQTSSSQPRKGGGAVETRGDSTLITDQGRTTIADGVVAKIAGIATREVDGVHAIGGGAARAVGAVRERMGGKTHGQGVSVEVGERQSAVDVDVVLEYGVAIADVAALATRLGLPLHRIGHLSAEPGQLRLRESDGNLATPAACGYDHFG